MKLHQPAVPTPISKSEVDPRRKWTFGRTPIRLARVQGSPMALGAVWVTKRVPDAEETLVALL